MGSGLFRTKPNEYETCEIKDEPDSHRWQIGIESCLDRTGLSALRAFSIVVTSLWNGEVVPAMKVFLLPRTQSFLGYKCKK